LGFFLVFTLRESGASFICRFLLSAMLERFVFFPCWLMSGCWMCNVGWIHPSLCLIPALAAATTTVTPGW
jgi:hypothetical protein